MDKLNGIQILRGLAASIVVYHHFMQIFYKFESNNFLGDFFSNYGDFGVDIFFVISGLVMAISLQNKKQTSASFFKNRLVRIAPTYYFYTLIFLLMGIIFDSINSSHASIESVLKSLLFITHENPSPDLGFFPTLSVGWTLNFEMFFYLVLTLILFLPFSILSKLAIAVFVLSFSPVLYKITKVNIYEVVAGNYKLIEFSLGILLGIAFNLENKLGITSKLTYFTKLTLLLLGFILLQVVSHPLVKELLLASYVVLLFIFFGQTFNKKNSIIKFFIYLGEISYSVYLSHLIIIFLIWSFLPILDNYYLVILGVLLTTLGTFFVSVITHKHIEVGLSTTLKEYFR
ncbi:acyltransferase [Thalassotalea fonticola]|uniref:Acyltransferase n=1 Tax=Thalassotalea fonticola TaxID=3065649 RepID=A0ABZ0GSP4_9GAMM|nr:acyltransferase [Colwelliaceae bacterium S1-1]